MPLLLIAFIALIFISVVLFMALSISRRRKPLYRWDTHNVRSCVTFKPLLGHTFVDHQNDATDILQMIAHGLQNHPLNLDGYHNTPHKRLRVNFQGQSFELSLSPLDKFPEEWVMSIAQIFKHGKSTPHDTPTTLAFVGIVQEVLHAMPIGTVRWHKRQDFNRGQIDLWSYQPY